MLATGPTNWGGGSTPPLGSGTYAEPLIPLNEPETGPPLCGTAAALKACNASISAGQNQPYWIDISVPHGVTNSPAGTYTGTISITTAQGNATVPVTLTVWNFGLPVQPSELSLWTLWPPAAGNTTTTLGQALMRNKVMGWYDVAANASSDITNFGLNRSGLDGYYFIGIQCNGSSSSIPSTSQINAAAANFPAGLGLDFYLADELNGCTSDYTAIKTMGANAHAANRSVKTMMTINATDSNLYGAIDHWVLLDSVQQWPALPFTAGGDLWSYTSCNAGFGNAPEWMVDYPFRSVAEPRVATGIAPEVAPSSKRQCGPLLHGIQQHPMVYGAVQVRVGRVDRHHGFDTTIGRMSICAHGLDGRVIACAPIQFVGKVEVQSQAGREIGSCSVDLAC